MLPLIGVDRVGCVSKKFNKTLYFLCIWYYNIGKERRANGMFERKFKLGQVVATRGVNEEALANGKFAEFVMKSFMRHCDGDWGDLCEEDKAMNDMALKSREDRILSKYDFNGDTSIYIITEWDGSATTILFPSEY